MEQEKKDQYTYENMKEQLRNMIGNNYEDYVKAQISVEKGIEDEEVLEKVYSTYMESDYMSGILNDDFDKIIEKAEKEVTKNKDIQKIAFQRLNQIER